MPYSGVEPGSETEKKIERCVEGMMTDDPEMDKSSAIAICRDSIEGKSMISQTKEGKFKVKGYDDEFDSGPDAVTFMRSMMVQKRKDALAKKGIYGPTSFDELDELLAAQHKADKMYWLTSDFMWLVDNVVWDSEVEDKAAAVKSLADEFSTRIDDLSNEPDAEMGMKSQTFIDKVKDAVLGALRHKKEPDVMELKMANGSLKFYKSGDVLKWVATYSNNLIDDDNPKEIIAADSHKKHVALVKAGLVNPPDLWLWHEPDWQWGTGEYVTYDEQGDVVFTIAGGSVSKGFEELAETICESDEWGVSHGMPLWSVSHDKDNPHVIVEHITEEVSPLPMWAAANKFTSFSLNKEAKMIPKQEKARLMAEFNVSEDLLKALEQSNTTKAQKAATQGRLFKDGNDAPVAEPQDTPAGEAEGTDEPVADEPVAEPTTSPEVVEVKQADLEAIVKSLTVLAERVNELDKRVAAKDAEIDKAVAEKAAETPLASLLAHMQKAVSPIGNPDAAVDGRTSLAKSQPVETAPVPVRTGIPMVDGFLNGGGK